MINNCYTITIRYVQSQEMSNNSFESLVSVGMNNSMGFTLTKVGSWEERRFLNSSAFNVGRLSEEAAWKFETKVLMAFSRSEYCRIKKVQTLCTDGDRYLYRRRII